MSDVSSLILSCGVGVMEPKIVVVNSSAVDISWFKPTSANGLISSYQVYRSSSGQQSVLLYSGPPQVYSTVDARVEPGVQYRYLLEAANSAGAGNSSWVIVTLPQATPDSIPAITNFTALSSESIVVEWDPLPSNSSVDQFRVLIDSESPAPESEWPAASTSTSLVVVGLRPYSWYSARLAACLRGVLNGCGTGPVSERIRTLEAPPLDQLPPSLTSPGPTTVVVSWRTPLSPNGLILFYRIRRRACAEPPCSSSDSGILVNIVNGSVHSFVNRGLDLRPFTTYEYSIMAVNSQGEATSNWSDVRTAEATPKGMVAPVVASIGAYTFLVSWQPPSQPNGQVRRYAVEYGAANELNDPGSLYVPATALNTSVSGVRPYAHYSLRVRAENAAGFVVSGWTNFTTLPASPSGLGAMSVEPVSDGRSAILSWLPPAQPNGRILNYAIYTDSGSDTPVYDGPNRLFELAALEPYTKYGVRLQACTVAGCTRSPWQRFVTSQAPPANQRSPSTSFVNDSSVLIAWSRPAKTYGEILMYEVRRRTMSGRAAASFASTARADYTTIYTTTNTTPSYFTFLDNTVLPFTGYNFYSFIVDCL